MSDQTDDLPDDWPIHDPLFFELVGCAMEMETHTFDAGRAIDGPDDKAQAANEARIAAKDKFYRQMRVVAASLRASREQVARLTAERDALTDGKVFRYPMETVNDWAVEGIREPMRDEDGEFMGLKPFPTADPLCSNTFRPPPPHD